MSQYYDFGNVLGSALGAYRDIVALQDHSRQRRLEAENQERRDAASRIAGSYFTRAPNGQLITRDESEVVQSPDFINALNSDVYQKYLKEGISDPAVAKVRIKQFHDVGADQNGQRIYVPVLQHLDEDGNVLREGPATIGRGSADTDPVHRLTLNHIHQTVMSDLRARDSKFADEIEQQVVAGQRNRIATMLHAAKSPDERKQLEDFAIRNGFDLADLGKAAGLSRTALNANGARVSVDPYGNESFAGVSSGLQAANRNAAYHDTMSRAQAAEDADQRFGATALERRLAQDRALYTQKRGLELQDAYNTERLLGGGSGGPGVSAPHEADAVINQAAIDNNIDPRLLKAVGLVESGLNPAAVSPKGARGPFQFMPATAEQYGVTDPHDMRQAANGAARYLRDLTDMFGGDTEKALTAYNYGPGALMKALRSGEPLPKEAAEYAGKVQAAMTPAPESTPRRGMSLAERAQLRAAGLKPDEVLAKREEQAATDYANTGGVFRRPGEFVAHYAKMNPDARARVRGELGRMITNPASSPEQQTAARARLLEADFADGRVSSQGLKGKAPKPATYDDIKSAVSAGAKADDVAPLTTEGYGIFGALNSFIAATGDQQIAQHDDAKKGAAATATREAWAMQQRDPEYAAENLVGPLYLRNLWRNQYKGGTLDSAEDYADRVVLPLVKASEAAPTDPQGMSDRLRMTTALISKGMSPAEAIDATLQYEQDPGPTNDALRAKLKGPASADDVYNHIVAVRRQTGDSFFGAAGKRELEKLRADFRATHPNRGPGLPTGENVRSVGGLLKGLSGLPDSLPKTPVYGATR